MRDRFEIGDEGSGMLEDRYEWLKQTFIRSDYLIYSDGFIYNTYFVEFLKPEHATLYRLRWP